ncbi:MAG: hypothetical protein QM791_05425 [Ferruginibacter sp.]
MRSLFLLLIIACSCKEKALPKSEDELDVIETEMAEIRGPENLSSIDSVKLIGAFKTLLGALDKEDGILLSKVTYNGSRWDRSLNNLLYTRPFNAEFLITAPVRNLYKEDIWSVIKKDSPKISSYNTDTRATIFFTTRKTAKYSFRKVIVETEHQFEFSKEGNDFKFSRYEQIDTRWQHIYPPIDSIIAYFPRSGSSKHHENKKGYLSHFEIMWYSNPLKIGNEPILYNRKGKGEIYRFTWLRSFHMPVIIRVHKSKNEFLLTAKLIQEGYYDIPEAIITNSTKEISYFKWQKFKELLSKANFHNLPVEDNSDVGTDGAQWIMEVYENGEYHFITRWSPGNSDFGKACKYLLGICGLEIKKNDIY